VTPTPPNQPPRGQSAPLRLLVNNGGAKPAPSKFDFIDLFAGIGGMRIPFDELGGECVFSSEWDKDAQDSYEANYGHRPTGDITEIDPASIPDHDILTGGFPCQAFSVAGNMRGFEDTRGTLFFNVAAILAAKRPRAFLLENVKHLRTHDGGQTYATIEAVLTGLGYHVHTKVLNALDFGLPQRRQRTIIVGFRDEAPFEFPAPLGPPPSLATILEPTGVAASAYIKAKRLARLKAQGDKPFTPSMWHENKSQHISVLPYSVALRTSASHNYILVNGERLPTSRELLRLQGFPEDFKIVVSHAAIRHQTGNAVPVPMIRAVAQNMVAAMRKPQALSGSTRWKPRDDDFGGRQVKFKYLPKEKWRWAA
jgi:DNA (cytosine-5)-methyltransferase 1